MKSMLELLNEVHAGLILDLKLRLDNEHADINSGAYQLHVSKALASSHDMYRASIATLRNMIADSLRASNVIPFPGKHRKTVA